jgi:hypothetical protein
VVTPMFMPPLLDGPVPQNGRMGVPARPGYGVHLNILAKESIFSSGHPTQVLYVEHKISLCCSFGGQSSDRYFHELHDAARVCDQSLESTTPNLILSYRAADSFLIHDGELTNELESCTRLVRGRIADFARFSFKYFPMPRRRQHVASLYELQDLSRKQTA